MMKKRLNRLLLFFLLLSTVLSILSILIWIEVIPDLGIPMGDRAITALILSAFPAFFLQMLLCRNGNKGWVRALPLLILLCIVLVVFLAFAAASGWDSLGWLLLLILCIPPAVGILLAFLIHCLTNWK